MSKNLNTTSTASAGLYPGSLVTNQIFGHFRLIQGREKAQRLELCSLQNVSYASVDLKILSIEEQGRFRPPIYHVRLPNAAVLEIVRFPSKTPLFDFRNVADHILRATPILGAATDGGQTYIRLPTTRSERRDRIAVLPANLFKKLWMPCPVISDHH